MQAGIKALIKSLILVGSNEAYGNGNLSVNLIYRDEDGPDT